MAGKTKPASEWEMLDRLSPTTSMRRMDPSEQPFRERPANAKAFRPVTIQDRLLLAEAPKSRTAPAPYIVDRPAATYDHRGERGPDRVLDLRHYRSGDVLRLPGADVRVTDTGPVVELKAQYGRGREAARRGPVLVPPGPEGVSVDANREEAARHPPWWLMEKVPNGAPWDYKQQGRRFEAFGNFNFGAVGRSARLPEDVLLRGAGWAQGRAHESGPDFGNPYLGTGSYGDDPVDQFWVVQGSRYDAAKRRR